MSLIKLASGLIRLRTRLQEQEYCGAPPPELQPLLERAVPTELKDYAPAAGVIGIQQSARVLDYIAGAFPEIAPSDAQELVRRAQEQYGPLPLVSGGEKAALRQAVVDAIERTTPKLSILRISSIDTWMEPGNFPVFRRSHVL